MTGIKSARPSSQTQCIFNFKISIVCFFICFYSKSLPFSVQSSTSSEFRGSLHAHESVSSQ